MQRRSCLFGQVALLVTAVTAFSAYAEVVPTATISGGADAPGHQYAWTVTNTAQSAIVELRFPHYRAGLFFAPEGWSKECTALVGVGVKDEPGVCVARSNLERDGIAPGRSAAFQMQIAAAGAKRAAGTVTVRFADGAETTVAGVELPTRESAGDKYVSLLGLTAIFIGFVVWQSLRRRRGGGAPRPVAGHRGG